MGFVSTLCTSRKNDYSIFKTFFSAELISVDENSMLQVIASKWLGLLLARMGVANVPIFFAMFSTFLHRDLVFNSVLGNYIFQVPR